MAHLVAWMQSLQVEKAEGQGLVEYALIIVLVSIACIALLGFLGVEVGNVFADITGTLAAR